MAAAMLAACGGSQPPGALPQSWVITAQDTRYVHSVPLLYVSSEGTTHDVKVYAAGAKDPTPIRIISDGLLFPAGLCLDAQGTLYAADRDGWVAEYHARSSKPFRVITKGTDNLDFVPSTARETFG
jgi:hypothetical protein